MSGICDTCMREHLCSLPIGEVLSCSYYRQSRWQKLFGTPERAARTVREIVRSEPYGCTDCPLAAFCDMPADIGALYDGAEHALLEWLRGDAE